MPKILKLVSIPESSYNINRIVEIIGEEKSDKHPMLVVLPEYFHTKQKSKLNERDRETNKALQIENGKVIVDDPTVKANMVKLIDAAGVNNAHIFFSGTERIGKWGFPTSGFIVTPFKKEPVIVVRRKIVESGKEGPRSIKTIEIAGFEVLPLICEDVLSLDWVEKPKRIKKADIIAVSAHNYTAGGSTLISLENVYNQVKKNLKVATGAVLVMADDATTQRKWTLPWKKGIEPAGIYARKKSEWKEYKGVSYFTYIHRK